MATNQIFSDVLHQVYGEAIVDTLTGLNPERARLLQRIQEQRAQDAAAHVQERDRELWWAEVADNPWWTGLAQDIGFLFYQIKLGTRRNSSSSHIEALRRRLGDLAHLAVDLGPAELDEIERVAQRLVERRVAEEHQAQPRSNRPSSLEAFQEWRHGGNFDFVGTQTGRMSSRQAHSQEAHRRAYEEHRVQQEKRTPLKDPEYLAEVKRIEGLPKATENKQKKSEKSQLVYGPLGLYLSPRDAETFAAYQRSLNRSMAALTANQINLAATQITATPGRPEESSAIPGVQILEWHDAPVEVDEEAEFTEDGVSPDEWSEDEDDDGISG